MATPLKNYYSDDYIALIARELAAITDVKATEFSSAVLAGNWSQLSLKERSTRLTDCLVTFLPNKPAESIKILKELLPKISGDAQKYADMLCLFVPEYVARHQDTLSLDDAVQALCFFTSNGTTSEMAIRPFLDQNADAVFQIQKKWFDHKHPHVRRWISEGCRPRLPWANALPKFKTDPSPILEILTHLRADDSKFVQKSVANNLNDIAKDHPDRVLDFAEKWIDSHPNTNWILKHGLRTLLKSGNSRALALFGAVPLALQNPTLSITHQSLSLGQSQEFNFSATITGSLPDRLRIEYAIDFRKATGKMSRKVFMGAERKPENKHIELKKSHRFIDYTTRKHYAGTHGLTILVNGAEICTTEFELIDTPSGM